jgi:hypothetical protein
LWLHSGLGCYSISEGNIRLRAKDRRIDTEKFGTLSSENKKNVVSETLVSDAAQDWLEIELAMQSSSAK